MLIRLPNVREMFIIPRSCAHLCWVFYNYCSNIKPPFVATTFSSVFRTSKPKHLVKWQRGLLSPNPAS